MIGRIRKIEWLILGVILIFFDVLAAESIRTNSVMIDEFAHLPAGVAYWRDGAFSMYDENPPFARLMISLPAFIAGAKIDYDRAHIVRRWEWFVGQDFRKVNRRNYFIYFYLGRFVTSFFALACGLMIFHCMRRDFGSTAGLTGVAIWFTDPSIIAHSTIATTDIASTTLCFFTTASYRSMIESPTIKKSILTGLLLGLAIGTKFSALILFPVMAILLITIYLHDYKLLFTMQNKPLIATIVSLLISVIVLNMVYFFHGSPTSLDSVPFHSPFLASIPDQNSSDPVDGNRFIGTLFGRIPLPIPVDYIKGFDSQLFDQQVGKFANLSNGRIVNGGFWYSPLINMLYKTPIGTLALISLSIIALFYNIRKIKQKDIHYIVFPLFFIGFLCSQRGLNFAYRYSIPAIPFLICFIGGIVNHPWNIRMRHAPVIICLSINILSVLGSRPYYLSYGNELIGGVNGAQKIFMGSNFDWGQDLFRLKNWADQLPDSTRLIVSYYGPISPTELSIPTTEAPSCLWDPNSNCDNIYGGFMYWAISSNSLNGLPTIVFGDKSESPPGVIQSSLLNPKKSYTRIGSTIFIFRIVDNHVISPHSYDLKIDDLKYCLKPFRNNDPIVSP